jgi:hypothetical protein
VTKLGQLTREERYPISLEPFSLLFSTTGVDQALTEGFQGYRVGLNLTGETRRQQPNEREEGKGTRMNCSLGSRGSMWLLSA